MTAWLLLALLLAGQPSADHTDVVATAKRQVLAAGINPDVDDCARWEITRRVVLQLAGDGAGFIGKSGSNCRGYATDAIMYRDGTVVDVIGAGPEGPNSPHWIVQPAKRPLSDWRPPIDLDPVPPPTPPPVPPPGPDEHAAIAAKLDQVLSQMEGLRQQQAADTERLQQQIDQVVKNAEKSAAPLLLKILSLGLVK